MVPTKKYENANIQRTPGKLQSLTEQATKAPTQKNPKLISTYYYEHHEVQHIKYESILNMREEKYAVKSIFYVILCFL
jgi:predicted metallo-beta-lactamase superfamily hydrolase